MKRRSRSLARSIARLRLQPGDVLVVHLPADASHSRVERVSAECRRLLTAAGMPDQPVLIAPDDVRLSVLQPPAATCPGHAGGCLAVCSEHSACLHRVKAAA